MRELADIRAELDVIDKKITELFEERLELVTQVAECKIANGKPVLDRKREAEKLARLSALAGSEFSKSVSVNCLSRSWLSAGSGSISF